MPFSQKVDAHIRATGMNEKKYKKIQNFVDKILDAKENKDITSSELVAQFAKKCYANFDEEDGKKQAKKFLLVLYDNLDQLIKLGSVKALEQAASKESQMRIVRLNKPIGGYTKKLDSYLVGDTIGKGATSKVKLGKHEKTGKLVAVKILTVGDGKSFDMEELEKEIDVLKALNHKNVIRLYDCFNNVQYPGLGKNSSTTVMVLELATEGELFDFFMHTGKFEPDLARWFFKQMCDGLSYCHGKNIAHRDLKPENVLLGDNFLVKIVDFGFARPFKSDQGKVKMSTALGTPGYAAPEILQRKKYDASVDIFSLGVILFICIAGFPPFQEAKQTDWWFDKLTKKKFDLFWKAHERTHQFSKESKDLLLRMLAANPSERITWEKIKEHAWVKAKTCSQEEAVKRLKARKEKVDKEKYEAAKKSGVAREAPARALGECLPPVFEGHMPVYNFHTAMPGLFVKDEIKKYIEKNMMGKCTEESSGRWVIEPEEEGEKKATEEEKQEKGYEWMDTIFEVSMDTASKKQEEPAADSDDLPPVPKASKFEGAFLVRSDPRRKDAKGAPMNVVMFKRQGVLKDWQSRRAWNGVVDRMITQLAWLMAPPASASSESSDKKEVKAKAAPAGGASAVQAVVSKIPGMGCCTTGAASAK